MSKTEGGASAEGQSDSETHLVRIAAVVCQVKASERGARSGRDGVRLPTLIT